MSILLKNAWHEMIDTGMDIDDSRYDSIMIFEISGDELLTAYDAKGNEVRHVDSDMHGRCINFYDDHYFIKYAGKATKQYNRFAERRTKMTNDEFMKLCKRSVVDYFNGRKDSTDKNDPITEDNVFIVWMCKTLQNHKAMASTTVSDGMYYELTYNGDKDELYLDAYKKWQNVLIKPNAPKHIEKDLS